MTPSDTTWIFNFRGVLLELVVGTDGVIKQAEAPMEWAVGEKWDTVARLFEMLGSLTEKDPPR